MTKSGAKVVKIFDMCKREGHFLNKKAKKSAKMWRIDECETGDERSAKIGG